MSFKTIMLKGRGIRKEAIASSGITPGALIDFGGSKDVQNHATAYGHAQKRFAVENDLIGKGIDDGYTLGEMVQYMVPEKGSEVYALLSYGASATKGQALCSNGDGTLTTEATVTEDAGIVAYAMETLANTSGGVPVRIKVEVA